MTARLNVNIDHVATVRQARRAPEPSVIAAAMACEQAGADGITVHLRGDRRHIHDKDVRLLRETVTTYLNLEMAATEEMLEIARQAAPDAVESISYQIPTYKLNGQPLIYFAGWKHHISVYPLPSGGDESFERELDEFRSGKGTAQFPLDKPVPYDLIRKMVELHDARIKGIQD